MSYRFRRLGYIRATDGRPMVLCAQCRDGVAYSTRSDALCSTCKAENHRAAARKWYAGNSERDNERRTEHDRRQRGQG